MTNSYTKKSAYLLVLMIFILSSLPAKAKESEAVIKEKLHTLGQKLVQTAAKNVVPRKSQKAVRKEGNAYIASYVEIDTQSLRTELRPSETKGKYVGLIKYHEHHYQCRGASQQEALKADCIRSRSRNLTEIISYSGKWIY